MLAGMSKRDESNLHTKAGSTQRERERLNLTGPQAHVTFSAQNLQIFDHLRVYGPIEAFAS